MSHLVCQFDGTEESDVRKSDKEGDVRKSDKESDMRKNDQDGDVCKTESESDVRKSSLDGAARTDSFLDENDGIKPEVAKRASEGSVKRISTSDGKVSDGPVTPEFGDKPYLETGMHPDCEPFRFIWDI